MCVYICMYIYAYTYIHTYIHTYIFSCMRCAALGMFVMSTHSLPSHARICNSSARTNSTTFFFFKAVNFFFVCGAVGWMLSGSVGVGVRFC